MVECEFTKAFCDRVQKLVLIDTWWNVNNGSELVTENPDVVLIDTWWNVN